MDENRPTRGKTIWMACKILFAGAVTTVLAVCLGVMCGVGLPLFGGALGVAIAGAVFCYFWGWIVLGGEYATRCQGVGLLSLLVGAGLVVATMAIGAKLLGDQIAFRLAFGIAGMVVGAALGCLVPGRRHVGQSAAAGLVAWLIAGVIAVPTFGLGPNVGPAMFFALLYTPGIGLTLWGIVMGVMLVPRRVTFTKMPGQECFPNGGILDENSAGRPIQAMTDDHDSKRRGQKDASSISDQLNGNVETKLGKQLMSTKVQRGKYAFLVLATPIVSDCAIAVVLAFSGGLQSVHWYASVLWPLMIGLLVAGLWTGDRVNLPFTSFFCAISGLGLIAHCTPFPTNRLTPGKLFGHLAGWPPAVVILLGLWYLAAVSAFVFSPSIRAFFEHQRRDRSTSTNGPDSGLNDK